MKKVCSLTTFFLMSALLSACGSSVRNNGPVVTSSPTVSHSVVRLTARGANVTSMQINVQLPTHNQQNLRQYSGRATITGSLHANTIPCLSSAHSFSCLVEFNGVGNFEAQNCRIGAYRFYLKLALRESEHLRERYAVDVVNLRPLDFQCYQGNRYGVQNPHWGYPVGAI